MKLSGAHAIEKVPDPRDHLGSDPLPLVIRENTSSSRAAAGNPTGSHDTDLCCDDPARRESRSSHRRRSDDLEGSISPALPDRSAAADFVPM